MASVTAARTLRGTGSTPASQVSRRLCSNSFSRSFLAIRTLRAGLRINRRPPVFHAEPRTAASGGKPPAQVDEKAEQYYRLKAALDEATEAAKLRCLPLAQLKEELVQLVRDFGSAHAEKSRLLHGITQEMMVAFGSSVSIDAAAVERFRLALLEANQSRLLKKIFTKDIRFTMSPEAAVIIKGEKLSTGLLAIFSQVEVVKQKAPSLVVREK
jgi:hypothetical protein